MSGLKIFRNAVLALLAIAVIAGCIWHDAASAVFCNLTGERADLPETDSWEGGRIYEKVPYSDVSSSDCLDLYVPDDTEDPDLVVMVHGGGFVAGDSQSRQSRLIIRYFRDHGYAAASVNYRLAKEAAYPDPVADVKAAVRFLRANAEKYGFSAEHITIMGESAGGYLAAMAAVTDDSECSHVPFIGEEELAEPVSGRVQVLVDFYGCVELGNMDPDWEALHYPEIVIAVANSWANGDVCMGYENVESAFIRRNMSELSEEEVFSYYPASFAERNLPGREDLRVYIIHGDADITVPVLQSRRFYDTVSGLLPPGKTLLRIVPGAGHAADSIYSDAELEEIAAFMEADRD